MFAIIDVETTGLNPSGERITEIAKLLSGRELSEAAYQNARELLKIAGKAGSN